MLLPQFSCLLLESMHNRANCWPHLKVCVMRFLVKEISALSDLKDLVPAESPLHPLQKTETIPICVLFKDEKYTSETVDILAQLITDVNLNGQPQVHVHVYTKNTCSCMYGIMYMYTYIQQSLHVQSTQKYTCTSVSVVILDYCW